MRRQRGGRRVRREKESEISRNSFAIRFQHVVNISAKSARVFFPATRTQSPRRHKIPIVRVAFIGNFAVSCCVRWETLLPFALWRRLCVSYICHSRFTLSADREFNINRSLRASNVRLPWRGVKRRRRAKKNRIKISSRFSPQFLLVDRMAFENGKSNYLLLGIIAKHGQKGRRLHSKLQNS